MYMMVRPRPLGGAQVQNMRANLTLFKSFLPSFISFSTWLWLETFSLMVASIDVFENRGKVYHLSPSRQESSLKLVYTFTLNRSSKAKVQMRPLWETRGQWYPTWMRGPGISNALQVDYIRVYELPTSWHDGVHKEDTFVSNSLIDFN